jgi:hypothetical protein
MPADRWSVWYDEKAVDEIVEVGKHFRVTVEDKTKKVEVGK